MKDTSSGSHSTLPPCPQSEACLHFRHELETSVLSPDVDVREGPMIENLRVHLLICSTCQAALAEARSQEKRQRQALQEVLDLGEQIVPSTTTSILTALHNQELGRTRLLRSSDSIERQQGETYPLPLKTKTSKTRTWIGTLSSLIAVVALVLTSLFLFGRAWLHPPMGSSLQKSLVVHIPTTGWSSTIMSLIHDNRITIRNYDPVTHASVLLVNGVVGQVNLDAISYDGSQLLYRVYDGKNTYYTADPAMTKNVFYTVEGEGRHAIWSTDDHFLFIATSMGVERVDTSTKGHTLLVSSPRSVQLQFADNRFLYLTDRAASGVLKRWNSETGELQILHSCSAGGDFRLSPDGSLIYATCIAEKTLTVMQRDGSNSHILHTSVQGLVGYTRDGSPLVLEQRDTHYQIIQLGGEEHVVLEDIAPGSSFVGVSSVAVAPYGHALLVKGIYSNGQERVWSWNIEQKTKDLLYVTGLDEQALLQGWTRIKV